MQNRRDNLIYKVFVLQHAYTLIGSANKHINGLQLASSQAGNKKARSYWANGLFWTLWERNMVARSGFEPPTLAL